MEHSRRAQHLHVHTRELVQHFELLKDLHRKVHNMADVVLVEFKVLDEGVEAVAEDIRNRLFGDGRHGVLEHCALSHTATADHKVLKAANCDDTADAGKRAGEDIRAGAGKTFDLHRTIKRHSLDGVVNRVEFAGFDVVAVRHVQRILLDPAADLAEVTEGTADADKLRVGIQFLEPLELFKLGIHGFLDLFRTLFGQKVLPFEHIGQSHRAKRQRRLLKNGLSVVVDQFSTAAAHIHDQALGDIHRVDDAGINVLTFFRGAQNAKFDAASDRDFLQKALLVLGASDSGGGKGKNLFHAVGIAEPPEHLQRFLGLFDPRRSQESVDFHVLSKPHAFL